MFPLMRASWLKLGALSLLPAVALAASLPPPPPFLLPDSVAPVRYKLDLSIDPGNGTLSGEVRIDVELREPTTLIWLNGKDLTAHEASVEAGGRTVEAHVRAVGGEYLALQLSSPVGPGRATVSLQYRGRIDARAVFGLYRRKVEGHWYVYSTFTPIEARRAFPCFDELQFKTPWDISIRVPRGNKAFSNGREISDTEEPDGSELFRFATTEPLPTEVVALAVGPFDVYDGGTVGDTPVRVLTPVGHAVEGKAAADATAVVLPELEAYTGIPYPFGKLDEAPLADAAFGAVENPGLIVFLSKELLVAPNRDSSVRTRALRSLEAHELAHQWFGDMVTQASWRDIWLSEGFATWLASKVMDHEQIPERAHLDAVETREQIMAVDNSIRARPVRREVRGREDSHDIYNRVVYDKGASVLLMLEGWLGPDKMREGLRTYLAAHRFGNASTADLVEALRNASGIGTAAVLDTFLDTTGVPRVEAEVKCDAGAPRLEIRDSGPGAIPVCYRGDGVSKACVVVNGPPQEVELPAGSACPAWIDWNAGGTGYYRSVWTAPQLAALPLDELTPAERLTLAFDLRAFNVRTASRGPAQREVLSRLASDPDPEIAAAARQGLR